MAASLDPDAASSCLDIAGAAIERRDTDKVKRFCEKAKRLGGEAFHAKAEALLSRIAGAGADPKGSQPKPKREMGTGSAGANGEKPTKPAAKKRAANGAKKPPAPRSKKAKTDSNAEKSPPAKKPKKAAKGKAESSVGDEMAPPPGWSVFEETLLVRHFGTPQPSRKVALFDMDGTLIVTRSGATFPLDENDWALFNGTVFQTLQNYADEGFRVVVVSNQGGIGKKVGGKMSRKITAKIEQIYSAVGQNGFNFPITWLLAAGKHSMFRKPGTGMFQYYEEQLCGDDIKTNLKQSFMVGDMAGRPGDVSATDKEFAQAAGLRFLTPEECFGSLEMYLAQHDGGVDPNGKLCALLIQIAEELDKKDNPFGARAYKKAARILGAQKQKVESGAEAMALPGIGKGIGSKVQEFLDTGHIKTLDELRSDEAKEAAKKEAEEKGKGEAFAFMDF